MSISAKLNELGLELPQVPKPVANYIPAKISGNQIYTSGQLPFINGSLLVQGLVDVEKIPLAQKAAAQAFLNALAAAASLVNLDQIRGVLRLGVYVASTADFVRQPEIANGASDLAVAIFGESGRHVRTAVGVSALPLSASVELEVVFDIE